MVYPSKWAKAWMFKNTILYSNSSFNTKLYRWSNCELRTAVMKLLEKIFLRQTVDG